MSARRPPDGDDGRTVANMNVEGMPWHTPDAPAPENPSAEGMTKGQLRRYTFYAVLSGLAVVGVFGLLGALFIWFCTDVWFR